MRYEQWDASALHIMWACMSWVESADFPKTGLPRLSMHIDQVPSLTARISAVLDTVASSDPDWRSVAIPFSLSRVELDSIARGIEAVLMETADDRLELELRVGEEDAVRNLARKCRSWLKDEGH